METGEVLIVIPARNEAARLPRVVDGVAAVVPRAQVLVVEDGSSDDTVAVARRLGARVVHLPISLGYGGAVRVGFQYAQAKGYRYVVTLDADGQHDPGDLPALLGGLDGGPEGGNDLVVGSRFLGRSTYTIPLARRVGMALFSLITSFAVGKKVSDTTSGFMGVGPRALPVVAAHCATDFPNAELICIVARHGLAVGEVPVTIHERTDGESMFTFWRAVYYPFKLLLSISMVFLRKGR
jgi:Glycosyl transferase family 2